MNASQGHKKFETLGERLSRLGPGDPCPCCGARMEMATSPAAAVRSALMSEHLSGSLRQTAASAAKAKDFSDALRCPVCGCEVETDEWPSAANACRAFSAAA